MLVLLHYVKLGSLVAELVELRGIVEKLAYHYHVMVEYKLVPTQRGHKDSQET